MTIFYPPSDYTLPLLSSIPVFSEAMAILSPSTAPLRKAVFRLSHPLKQSSASPKKLKAKKCKLKSKNTDSVIAPVFQVPKLESAFSTHVANINEKWKRSEKINTQVTHRYLPECNDF